MKCHLILKLIQKKESKDIHTNNQEWIQDLKENDSDLGTQGFKAKKDLTIIKVPESFLIKTPPTVNGAISKEKYHGVIILFLLQ